MSVPPEIAWVVPIAVPFVIGLLVGTIVKRAVKLVLAVIALVAVLVATGSLSLAFKDLWEKAMEFLPKLYEFGAGYLNALPYTSISFLIGFALALGKA